MILIPAVLCTSQALAVELHANNPVCLCPLPSRINTTQAPLAPAAPLPDWAAYCRLRGLSLDSPAVLLLDAVLTLHSAVLRAWQPQPVAAQEPALLGAELTHGSGAGSSDRLVLHLLGPQKELDQWPLLLELGCLLPPTAQIELHLVGPDVPPETHGRSIRVATPAAGPCGRPGCSCARQEPPAAAAAAPAATEGQQEAGGGGGSMALFFWRGAYHELSIELARQHGQPSVVVAPNAGEGWVEGRAAECLQGALVRVSGLTGEPPCHAALLTLPPS